MGGVVFRQNTQEAFNRFREIGVDPNHYMGQYGQKEFFLDLETGTIDTDEFCRRLAVATGRDAISYDEAEHCWLGFVEDVPVENLHNLLKLKERYRLGLLSNTNPFIMGYTRSERFSAERLPITQYFHSFFCSYEMKVCKPSLDIYKKALAADNMKPEETIFVDDSIANIKAAEEVGIHGLHVPTNEDWLNPLGELLSKLS